MPDINIKYGTTQGITCTLASLANAAARQSTAIDNRTNKFLDALVSLLVRSGAAGTLATGHVNVYAYGTVNDGTDYSDGATGSDAPITMTSPPNLRLIGVINVVANAVSYRGGPFSVAAAFGGVLPALWGIVVENRSGAALDGTEANFKKEFQGIKRESV